MNNKKSQRKSKEKDIKERGFSFACRIVKLYQFLAKKKGGDEVFFDPSMPGHQPVGSKDNAMFDDFIFH